MTAVQPLDVPRITRLTVEHFMILDEAGAFDGASKTELIDGVVYEVNAQYSWHFRAKGLLYRRIADVCDTLGDGLSAWTEGAVRLSDHDMPEPDIFVMRDVNLKGPAEGDRALLIVEVADTTLSFDMTAKAAIYARAGLPEYWVLDLGAAAIHRMTRPEGEAYAAREQVALGGVIESLVIPGLAVDTAGI